MLPTVTRQGNITPQQMLLIATCIIMIDKTSRKPQLVGLNDYTSYPVIAAVNELISSFNPILASEHLDIIRKIKTDAGSQVTSSNFREACVNNNIELSIAQPNNPKQFS
jgi:hypothetical protein